MASIGQQLIAPESGWKRYDDTSPSLKYVGTWTHRTGFSPAAYNSTDSYTSAAEDTISFDFIGTKIRIISYYWSSFSNDCVITIDGISYAFSEYSPSNVTQALVFELTGLTQGRHTVSMRRNSGTAYFGIDAIDIDDTGRLFHPDEVTDLKYLTIGKRIRMHYFTYNNKVGFFSGVGNETSDFIPSFSVANPDGDFYAICVDMDRLDRPVLVADRNVQHSISWDTLNGNGVASGSGLPLLSVEGAGLFSGIVYVDAINGLDTNIGTESYPVRTISKALSLAGTGWAIKLLAGVYPINTANKYLHELCTTKGITFVGEGESTILEVGSCPISYSQPTGSSANFFNMVIRPSNSFTGDSRVIWYNSFSTATNFKLWFRNVAFAKSPNGTYPTDRWFYWTNNSPDDPNVKFENCSFASVPGLVENTPSSTNYRYVNCAFGGVYSSLNISVNLGCLFNVTFDSNWNIIGATWQNAGYGSDPDGTVADIGVYGGFFDWGVYTFRFTDKVTVRLLTGGINSSDVDNEWNQYIVNSDLNGIITPGDNNVWNWSGIASWSSSTVSGTSANRSIRGNSSVTGFYSVVSSTVGTGYGFRPVLIIEYLSPIFDGLLDHSSVNREDVILSGIITEPSGLNIRYKIIVNGIQEYPDSGFTNLEPSPITVEYTILNNKLVIGQNIITLTIENENGISSDYNFQVNKINNPPLINSSMVGMKLTASISDSEDDAFQYKIVLNGNKIFPEGVQDFTELQTGSVEYFKIFKSNEINIGQNNQVLIIAQDEFGESSSQTINFIGDYSNLIFVDPTSNIAYSDDRGNVLNYLSFGNVNSGDTSNIQKVRIVNKNPNKLGNIRVFVDSNASNTYLLLSKTDSPFEAATELLFDEQLEYSQYVDFYVKVVAGANDYGNIINTINLEAFPV